MVDIRIIILTMKKYIGLDIKTRRPVDVNLASSEKRRGRLQKCFAASAIIKFSHCILLHSFIRRCIHIRTKSMEYVFPIDFGFVFLSTILSLLFWFSPLNGSRYSGAVFEGDGNHCWYLDSNDSVHTLSAYRYKYVHVYMCMSYVSFKC